MAWGSISNGLALSAEFNDHLDIIPFTSQGLSPAIERDPPGDEPAKPGRVSLFQRRGSRRVMASVGIDRAEDDIVFQYYVTREGGRVYLDLRAG
jgi:hypothetical protein